MNNLSRPDERAISDAQNLEDMVSNRVSNLVAIIEQLDSELTTAQERVQGLESELADAKAERDDYRAQAEDYREQLNNL